MGRTRVMGAVLAVLTVPLLAGCAGLGPEFVLPPELRLTLILRVQDLTGAPIGNVRVFVDGEPAEWRTDDTFEPLGVGFPEAWQSFEVNWVSESYAIFLEGAVAPVNMDLAVRKVGWTDDLSLVRINDLSPEHLFVRDTMTLYPAGSGPEPVLHYAEIVAGPPVHTW
ncbi:MAG: hypothetical protein KKI08_08845 [Armatimonadetes bacterium]|nr:hypothetical protein [Armatimonadota bacterium]